MPTIPTFGKSVPVCPICEGPCTEDFDRSEYVFPDRLPPATTNKADDTPPEVIPSKANRRGRRARKPADDRMHRIEADRMHRLEGDR